MKWVAMAGLRGCMPNVCEEFDRKQDAISFLSDLHELKDYRTGAVKELRETGYADLDLHTFGNEYVEDYARRIAMDPDDIINILFEAGVDSEDLDELIHDFKSSEAADINNGDLYSQIEYLVDAVGIKGTMSRVGICEHGYYEGRGCDICEEQEWGDIQYHMRKDEDRL